MIPPKRRDDQSKITVVLDLDETLIYAREGPLYARPYAFCFVCFDLSISSPGIWMSFSSSLVRIARQLVCFQQLSGEGIYVNICEHIENLGSGKCCWDAGHMVGTGLRQVTAK